MAEDLTTRIREAYLAHRLNHSELVRVARQPSEELLDEFRDPHNDTREAYTPSELEAAWQQVGLRQEFDALTCDRAWSPYERALYRRLALPSHDECVAVERGKSSGGGTVARTALEKFDSWDGNADTRLEAGEIDRAMSDPEVSPEEAAALAWLRGHQAILGSVCAGDGAGVSRRDLAEFGKTGITDHPATTRTLLEEYAKLLERASAMPSPGPLAEEDKNPLDVIQGRQGACVLLSTAAGLGSSAFDKMFESNGDGTVTVTFADKDYEIVNELTLADRLYHAQSVTGGRWAGLLESAMAQRLFRQNRPEDGSVRSAGDGVPVQEAFLALTGRPAQEHALNDLSPDQTRELLRRVIAEPGPDICGTRPEPILRDPLDHDVEELHNGIPNSHAYTILGYDPETDQVKLRNPWHRQVWVNAPDDNSGIFEMPLTQFYSSFRWIAA